MSLLDIGNIEWQDKRDLTERGAQNNTGGISGRIVLMEQHGAIAKPSLRRVVVIQNNFGDTENGT